MTRGIHAEVRHVHPATYIGHYLILQEEVETAVKSLNVGKINGSLQRPSRTGSSAQTINNQPNMPSKQSHVEDLVEHTKAKSREYQCG